MNPCQGTEGTVQWNPMCPTVLCHIPLSVHSYCTMGHHSDLERYSTLYTFPSLSPPLPPECRHSAQVFSPTGITPLSLLTSAVLFGILWAATNYMYARALMSIAATDVTALFSSAPVFVFLFSICILQEPPLILRVSFMILRMGFLILGMSSLIPRMGSLILRLKFLILRMSSLILRMNSLILRMNSLILRMSSLIEFQLIV